MVSYSLQRARILSLWKKWAWLLPQWDLVHHFYEGPFELVTGKGSKGALAEARAQWMYLNGNVRWDLNAIATIDDTELEETVVHEMVHFLLNEMNSGEEEEGDLTAHEERVATTISRLFVAGSKKGPR